MERKHTTRFPLSATDTRIVVGSSGLVLVVLAELVAAMLRH